MPMEYRNQIVTGDARVLAERVPDESVDLIFTDPVYDRIDDYRWLAETAARVLKPSGQLAFYQAHVHYEQTFCALVGTLPFRWLVNEQKIGTQTTIWGRRVLCRVRHVFVYYKPPAMFEDWLVDYTDKQPAGKGNHKWSKQNSVYHWASRLGGINICDPFVGGGAVPAVCKQLQRNYIAFEIDPATAELARERVRNTQPPLFVPEPEQMEMEGIYA
jgi:hypothetical protein